MYRHTRMSVLVLLLLSVVVMSSNVACSSKTTTVTESRNADGGEEVVTTEVEVQEQPTGILSTSVGLVGDILALPFRIVAGVLQLVF